MDVVLLGTLLRAGEQVRVSAQLVEVPSGTVVSTRTAQVGLTDIFQLQDELDPPDRRRARASRCRPTTRRCSATTCPPIAEAYELYLRANHISEG